MAQVSDAGVALIKRHEGLSLQAYPDGPGWSVGYGHHGADVYMGLVITETLAEQLLRRDLERFANGVERALAVPATQEEFDAMVSLAYNIGLNAFRDSTLLRHHNAGRHADAAAEFGKWNQAGGKVLPGLERRRAAEAARYREGGRAG